MNFADLIDDKGELTLARAKTKDDLAAAVTLLFDLAGRVFAGDVTVLNAVLASMGQPEAKKAPGAHPRFAPPPVQ